MDQLLSLFNYLDLVHLLILQEKSHLQHNHSPAKLSAVKQELDLELSNLA